MKFYIATALERAAEQQVLKKALEDLGHEITYDWAVHGSVQEAGEAKIREVSSCEMNGVEAADLVVVLLPGGRGTHTELGAAIAFAEIRERTLNKNKLVGEIIDVGKKIVIIGPLAGADGRACCFYYHPAVGFRMDGTSEFLAFMRGIQAAGGVWK